jgi:hypothetical protein
MKVCELKINNGEDRATIVSILAFAGYKVSIETRNKDKYSNFEKEYFVIVETCEKNDKDK